MLLDLLFEDGREELIVFWQNAGIMKWEYLIISVAVAADNPKLNEKATREVNEKGEEGWELVAVRPVKSGFVKDYHVLYFKRPKQ